MAMAAAATACASACSALQVEPALARFALLGHDCVVVGTHGAAMVGHVQLGQLLVDGRRYLVLGRKQQPTAPDPVSRLTPRELGIALLIAGGCCNKTIARRLEISCHTVGAHVGRIFAKLCVHKRTELTARVVQRLSVGAIVAS